MFCPSCGKEINENEKFCGRCGFVIKDAVAAQKSAEKKPVPTVKPAKPVKDPSEPGFFEARAIEKQLKREEKLRQKKQAKEEKKAARKQHRKETHFYLKLTLCIIAILAVAGGTLTALSYFHIVDIPIISSFFDKEPGGDEPVETPAAVEEQTTDETGEPAEEEGSYQVEETDAEEYFNNNATVVSQTDAASSAAVETEAQVMQSLADRGFSSEITYNYNMSGEYSDDAVASGTEDKHPVYNTVYITEDNFVWMIFDINGVVMAYPMSYNLENETAVVFSETDTLMSYDSATNKFFETKPNDITVIKVDVINAQTLESLTYDEIEALL